VRGPRYFPTCSHARPSTITNSSPPPLGDPLSSFLSPMPLLCTSSSSKVATLCNNQGVHNSSPGPLGPPLLLLLLLVSPLDTLLSTLHLFMGLSSHVLHSGTMHSSTLPPGVVSFLFISGLTPHRAPLAIYFPPLFSTFLLISTLLAYLSTLSLLYSSGSIPFLTSSQQFLDPPQWIHLLSHFPPSLQPPQC
jgi:hypothetical protein